MNSVSVLQGKENSEDRDGRDWLHNGMIYQMTGNHTLQNDLDGKLYIIYLTTH